MASQVTPPLPKSFPRLLVKIIHFFFLRNLDNLYLRLAISLLKTLA
jgi:hypothetical protein